MSSPLPPSTRLIHINDPSNGGADLIRKDSISTSVSGSDDPTSSNSMATIFVQKNLIAKPEDVMSGPEEKTDLWWVKSTGVSLAWIDIPTGYTSKCAGPGYTTSMDYVIPVHGSVEIGFLDGSWHALKVGDVFINCSSVSMWRNKGSETARIVAISTPSEPVLVDGKPLEEALKDKGVHKLF